MNINHITITKEDIQSIQSILVTTGGKIKHPHDIEYLDNEKNGWTKKYLISSFHGFRKAAHRYFEKCSEVLELDIVTYEFTPEQAYLLEFNGIKVRKEAIKEVK